MTTLQPRLVRADTLDLQSHNSPSAQDHSRSPTFSSYSHSSAGAHHREALRSAEESAYNDQMSHPHGAIDGGHNVLGRQTHLYDSADEEDGDDDQHDRLNGEMHQNGEYENGELEDEDELEDDLLDKISSSPSIEDGKYPPAIPNPWTDLAHEASPASSPLPTRGGFPFPEDTVPFSPCPITTQYLQEEGSRSASHHLGGYSPASSFALDLSNQENDNRPNLSDDDDHVSASAHSRNIPQSYSQNSIGSITKYLLPINDPLLDDASDEFSMDMSTSTDTRADDESHWVDEAVWYDDEDASSDDDTENFVFTSNPRFIDSGWGGECLRETEDIDFEFVYALHTFVATVEGQANATKGDTMVLLDDSNSYWWLVRVVKDGSIGYLPAEHIETPTERLARLNKHRNIDLAASMLGDNHEKSKNPLKKAMRRRNAKSVAFAPPTYYEPSEYTYSSDEEEEDEDQDPEAADQDRQATQAASEEIIIADDTQEAASNGVRNVATENRTVVEPKGPISADATESSLQSPQDENFQRTRNGVVRNTDSFFKDDTAETKKISLTPRLLRGDSEANNTNVSQPMSTDTFDKLLGDDKVKDEKKKKEKKGMLSGFFKRKDKKAGKSDAEDVLSPDDSLASPTSKDSMESVSSAPLSVERKTSKLQKAAPSTAPLKQSPTEAKISSQNSSAINSPITASAPVSTQPPVVQSSEPQTIVGSQEPQINDPSPSQGAAQTEKRSIFAPITTVLKPNTTPAEEEQPVKAVYSKRAKERFAIDTSDSDDESSPRGMQVPAPVRHSISPMLDTELEKSRPDSAMQVSPIGSADEQHEQVFHRGKANDLDDEATTPIEGQGQSDTASTSKPSPSLATHTPSTSRSTPTWSDASLRSYMDNDQDIRDLLIIIHDKTNVTPVGPDHPLMGSLFSTERTRLAEMQSQLDSMLTSWISKKNPNLLAN